MTQTYDETPTGPTTSRREMAHLSWVNPAAALGATFLWPFLTIASVGDNEEWAANAFVAVVFTVTGLLPVLLLTLVTTGVAYAVPAAARGALLVGWSCTP